MVAIDDLRPYQDRIAEAVLDSVQGRKGLTFSVMIARQGGKNEVSAWIEAFLLSAYVRSNVTAIKAAPTFYPQARISISRLERVLRRRRLPFSFESGHLFPYRPRPTAVPQRPPIQQRRRQYRQPYP